MIKLYLTALKITLLEYYSQPLDRVFKQFRFGLVCFGIGFVGLFMANQQLAASLQQELIVLFALILSGLGFIIAMMAQIRMLISRIILFARN